MAYSRMEDIQDSEDRLRGVQDVPMLDKLPVDRSLEELQEALSFIHERVLVLRERLNKVITSQPMVQNTKAEESPLMGSPNLSGIIFSKARSAQQIGGIVDDIINSLEL